MRRVRGHDPPAYLLVRRISFEMKLVLHQLREATVVLTVGTSGVVEPAASFARLARQNRARTIYVGPEEPANRAYFDEVILEKAGKVLPQLVETLLVNDVCRDMEGRKG